MKLLAATTATLALTSGLASADITVSGTARMGIVDTFGDTGAQFSSRVRIAFDASGETDSGLSFGASIRNDNAGGGNLGTDGSVYASFGKVKLSMGDVDGAANAAVGQVSGVGYTGLDDLNEVTFIGNGGADYDGVGTGPDDTFDPSALLEFTAGNLSLYVSATQWSQPTGGQAVAFAGKYTMGAYTLSLGYENLNAFDDYIWEQVVLGGEAKFGGVTVKAVYADGQNNQGSSWKQHAISATYTADALSVTAFLADDEDLLTDDLGMPSSVKSYGLGAGYDLGGGAKVQGGYVKNQTDDTQAFDLGMTFSF